MKTIKRQGKDHKVVATQENTAQNSTNQNKYEHIAQHYYPEDFEDTDLEGSDLSEAVCYEIESILVDWNTGNYCPDDWEDVHELIQAYADVLIANDLVVPEWVYSDATMQSNN